VVGTAEYGVLTAKAQAKARVTKITTETQNGVGTSASLYAPGASLPAGVFFNDVLTFPTLPSGTSALLSATMTLSGTESCSELVDQCEVLADLVFVDISSACSLTAAGTCVTTLTVTGGQSASLGSDLDVFATTGVQGGSVGIGTVSADFKAKITALTLTDANGTKYEIVAASGHKYPK